MPITQSDRDAVAAFHRASLACLIETTDAEIDAGINRAHDLLLQAFAAHRETAMAAQLAGICAWLRELTPEKAGWRYFGDLDEDALAGIAGLIESGAWKP